MNDINVEQFLKENNGMINKIVNKYYFETPKFSRDDLIATAHQSAINALKYYDATRESKPQSYVFNAVSNDVRQFICKNKYDLYVTAYAQKKNIPSNTDKNTTKAPNSWMAKRLDYGWDTTNDVGDYIQTYGEVLPSGSPPPEEQIMWDEQREILLEEINKLPENEQKVVYGRYFNGNTFVELGKELGVTKQRAEQIQKKAFGKLRHRLNNRLDGFIVRQDGLARK